MEPSPVYDDREHFPIDRNRKERIIDAEKRAITCQYIAKRWYVKSGYLLAVFPHPTPNSLSHHFFSMRASVFLAVSFVPALALANAIPDHAFLYERAPAPAVPESTPTGPACKSPNGSPVPSATAPSASEIASAVAGCQGVSAVGVTSNDIVNGICKPFTLIFARGTTESGNIGNIVGPPFVLALQNAFGASNVAVQGVNNYPATTTDYCTGGSISGSQNLAQVCETRPNVLRMRQTNISVTARPANEDAMSEDQVVR